MFKCFVKFNEIELERLNLNILTVQHECIPQAVLSMDVLCQAKSGMGKTAVFVLSTLQQLEQSIDDVVVLVIAHTRELAYQIAHEYQTFSKYMPEIKVAVFFGGLSIKRDEEVLAKNRPNVVVGTPGRLLALVQRKTLSLDNLRYFIVDECDQVLKENVMRKDVQAIFIRSPCAKQVMMFSATLNKDLRTVCKRFMSDVNIFNDVIFLVLFKRLIVSDSSVMKLNRKP